MVPEDSQHTRFGYLPKEWNIEKLDDVLDFLTDGTHFSPQSKTGPFNYITSRNIRYGYMDLTDVSYISGEEHVSIYSGCPVKFGDLLLTKDGANTGNAALNCLEEEFSLLSSVAVLRSKPSILVNEYLLQFVLSPLGQYVLKSEVAGQAITRLTLTQIANLRIIVPPLEQQRKIADILSTWDEAIDKLEHLIKAKEKRKRALMQQLLTGKKRFKEFAGLDGFEVKHLGDIAFVDKQSLGKNTESNYAFTYVSLSDVESGRILNTVQTIQFKDAPSRARRLVKKYDILMATVRPNLKAFAIIQDEVNNWIASTGFAFITAKKAYCPQYIFQYLFSSHVEKQIEALVTGSNYPAINSSEVKNLKVRCPTLPEQQKIAYVLSSADAEISTLQTQLDLYKQQKRGLMQVLLTGKKRVRV